MTSLAASSFAEWLPLNVVAEEEESFADEENFDEDEEGGGVFTDERTAVPVLLSSPITSAVPGVSIHATRPEAAVLSGVPPSRFSRDGGARAGSSRGGTGTGTCSNSPSTSAAGSLGAIPSRDSARSAVRLLEYQAHVQNTAGGGWLRSAGDNSPVGRGIGTALPSSAAAARGMPLAPLGSHPKPGTVLQRLKPNWPLKKKVLSSAASAEQLTNTTGVNSTSRLGRHTQQPRTSTAPAAGTSSSTATPWPWSSLPKRGPPARSNSGSSTGSAGGSSSGAEGMTGGSHHPLSASFSAWNDSKSAMEEAVAARNEGSNVGDNILNSTGPSSTGEGGGGGVVRAGAGPGPHSGSPTKTGRASFPEALQSLFAGFRFSGAPAQHLTTTQPSSGQEEAGAGPEVAGPGEQAAPKGTLLTVTPPDKKAEAGDMTVAVAMPDQKLVDKECDSGSVQHLKQQQADSKAGAEACQVQAPGIKAGTG